MSLTVLESLQRTSLKRFAVSCVHVLLVLIVCVFGGLLDVGSDAPHLFSVVTKGQLDGLALQDAVLHSELGILSNITSFGGNASYGRGNQNLKVAIAILAQSSVLGKKALLLGPVGNGLDLSRLDVRRIGIVCSHVAILGESKMHDGRVRGAEDSSIGSLVELVGFQRGGSQGRHTLLATSGNELGVTEALVVASVAEEHDSILEESGHLFLVDASLHSESSPVASRGVVEGNNEVIDGLRLR